MDEPQVSTDARHPIQVVARRTGLTLDTIRAWEKRYKAVVPTRSATSRRLYSEAEIERLQLLRRCTLAGRAIGQIAALPTEELRRLVAEDTAEQVRRSDVPLSRTSGPEQLLIRCLRAIRAMDGEALEDALATAAAELSMPVLFEQVLMPLLDMIGKEWREGTLRASHEHMATALVRSFLSGLRASYVAPSAGPDVIVTTPAGQLHELGALVVAIIAAREGWRVTYLGPNLPAEEIAAAARQRNAAAVALSLIYPADDPALPEELRKLRRMLPPGTAILVGGRAARAYLPALEEIDAVPVLDLDTLHAKLEQVRQQQARKP